MAKQSPLAVSFDGRIGSGEAQVLGRADFSGAWNQKHRAFIHELEQARKARKEMEAGIKDTFDLELDGWNIDNRQEIMKDRDEFRDWMVGNYRRGVNVNSNNNLEVFAEAERKKSNIKAKAEAYKSQGKVYQNALAKLQNANAHDHYAEESWDNVAEYRAMSIDERRDVDPTKLLVPKIDAVKEVDDVLGNIKNIVTDAGKGSPNEFGQVEFKDVSYQDPKVIADGIKTKWNDPAFRRAAESQIGSLPEVIEFARNRGKRTESVQRRSMPSGDMGKTSTGFRFAAAQYQFDEVNDPKVYKRLSRRGEGDEKLSGKISGGYPSKIIEASGNKAISVYDPVDKKSVEVKPDKVVEFSGSYFLYGRRKKGGSKTTDEEGRMTVTRSTTYDEDILIPIDDQNETQMLKQFGVLGKDVKTVDDWYSQHFDNNVTSEEQPSETDDSASENKTKRPSFQ